MEVEWLILCDCAQVVGNKLYLIGGGWDRLSASKAFPIQQHASIAVALKIPWAETNQRHKFEIEVMGEDQDSEQPKSMAKVQGQFEVGRPPGIPVGQDQRIQLAIDMILVIDSAGTKTVAARIDGEEARRITFNVIGTAARQ